MPKYKKYIETTKPVNGKPVKQKRFVGIETHTEASAATINNGDYGFTLVLKK